MSEWVVLAIAMTAACGVVLVTTMLRHRRWSENEDPSETPDVIEYMTMMVGVVYAIVLGLAIAGAWEARGAAEDNIHMEAQALHEVSERAQVYPAPVRDRIRDDINSYVRYVVNEEWALMAEQGQISERGTQLFKQVRRDVTEYVPRTDRESQTYQPLVDQVAAADEARNVRAQQVGATMPGVVWFGLIIGALVTVGMIFMLQIGGSLRELLLAGLFSALIAFLLFLIWDFDSPFGRGATVTAAPFLDLFPGV